MSALWCLATRLRNLLLKQTHSRHAIWDSLRQPRCISEPDDHCRPFQLKWFYSILFYSILSYWQHDRSKRRPSLEEGRTHTQNHMYNFCQLTLSHVSHKSWMSHLAVSWSIWPVTFWGTISFTCSSCGQLTSFLVQTSNVRHLISPVVECGEDMDLISEVVLYGLRKTWHGCLQPWTSIRDVHAMYS